MEKIVQPKPKKAKGPARNTWFDPDLESWTMLHAWHDEPEGPALTDICSAALKLFVSLPRSLSKNLIGTATTEKEYQIAIKMIAIAFNQSHGMAYQQLAEQRISLAEEAARQVSEMAGRRVGELSRREADESRPPKKDRRTGAATG
jgi:hypothetical protein